MDKIALERTNIDCIYLHQEGIFWKAYQHSAYLFVSYVASFKVKKIKSKTTGVESVSLGFPKSSLLHHFKQEQIEQIDEKQLKISGYCLDQEKYNSWLDAMPLTVTHSTKRKEEQLDQKEMAVLPIEATSEQRVIERLKTFRLEKSSPMDCMMFVAEAKEILHGNL